MRSLILGLLVVLAGMIVGCSDEDTVTITVEVGDIGNYTVDLEYEDGTEIGEVNDGGTKDFEVTAHSIIVATWGFTNSVTRRNRAEEGLYWFIQ